MPLRKQDKKGNKKGKKKRKKTPPPIPPGVQIDDELEPIKTKSPTAILGEALRTGISPYPRPGDPEIPGESKLKGGDPDVDTLSNEYSGEEIPGSDTPTPDQSNVDAIGRAYGIEEEDSGELRTSEEMLPRRDRDRAELKAPKKPRGL